ncbi:methionyl-tRNA formyltransferase [Mycoplasma sp. P36-A1]|uniref:methionyl-tRNA formyltransferase n=1 Tax=Mycoplasma sp. P36-A1 TaxID=3252900 RepID=UPI003C2F8B1A
MKNKKIIYMGTTDYSAYILQKLIDNKYNIIALISQPDKPFGRKKELKPTPTKEVALNNNIEVLAFDNINDNFDIIDNLKPDLIITCAYGQKVDINILNIPEYRSINVHASLLPKYRGGAPIHYAIMNGEIETGNTIMYMEEGLDTGDMLAHSITKIDITDTVSSLYPKMMKDGADLLISMLPEFFENKIIPIKQDNSKAIIARNITRAQEFITFNRDINVVYNHMRGLINWPGCYSILNNKKIKFHKIFFEKINHSFEPGLIKIDSKEYFKIYTNNGFIKVYEFQLEGKKKVEFKSYINGNKLEIMTDEIINKGVE